MATLPTSGPLPILPPALKQWGSPRRRDYVANMPISGPLLILPPALKRWRSLRQQGLRSHLAHKWATSESAPRPKAVGIPEAAGVA